MEVWENEKCCGNTSRRVRPNFQNSKEARSTCFLFLLEKTAYSYSDLI